MSIKKQVLCLLLIGFILVVNGCTTKQVATSPDIAATVAINVAIAQTAAIAQTSAAMTQVASQQSVPTETPAPSATPTIAFTATSNKVMLTLTRDTYCRKGTSASSPSVSLLSAGQIVEVIAHNPSNDSFYVVDPKHLDSNCWLWGQYATLTGEQTALPVYTSQPSPTATNTPRPQPNFTVAYVGMDSCSGNYYLRFTVKNTGPIPFYAYEIDLTDNTTKVSTTHFSTSFMDYTACAAGGSQSDLTYGESSGIAAYNPGQFAYDPTGHNITAVISLCQNVSGGCNPQILTLTP